MRGFLTQPYAGTSSKDRGAYPTLCGSIAKVLYTGRQSAGNLLTVLFKIPQRLDVGCPSKKLEVIFLMNAINPDWLVGFVDGEGCFYVGWNPNSTMKLGVQVLPEFA